MNGAGKRLSPVYQDVRFAAGSAFRFGTPPFRLRRWPGHPGVTGSLVQGLRQLAIPFVLNPLESSCQYKRVGVLSGLDTLVGVPNTSAEPGTQIVAGPNLVVLPSEGAQLLQRPEIRTIVVPSHWVQEMWVRDLPEISTKLKVWAAGVDYEYWSPSPGLDGHIRGDSRILVYVKQTTAPVELVLSTLRDLDLPFDVIKYGRYRPSQFRRLLREANLMVYLGGSESQGLALHEAWATDTPTLVYSPPEQWVQVPDGRSFPLAADEFSPAPYLTSERGTLWSTTVELQQLLERDAPFNYSPRSSSIDEFSLRVSARKYLDLFENPDE